MKAAEDQVVEDDARFHDDEVGLSKKKCVYLSHFSEQKQKVQNECNNGSKVKTDKYVIANIIRNSKSQDIDHNVRYHTRFQYQWF